MRPTTTAQELFALSGALVNATTAGFMAREHAAIIWKLYLKVFEWDIPKKEVTTQDGPIKES